MKRVLHHIAVALVVTLPSAALSDIKSATARAKAGDFDTETTVRCAQEVGETLAPCKAAIVRAGASAAIVVTFPNGFRRTLMFEKGAFLRGNTTMSGTGTDTDWSLEDGLYRIRVDDQQFEIPEGTITANE